MRSVSARSRASRSSLLRRCTIFGTYFSVGFGVEPSAFNGTRFPPAAAGGRRGRTDWSRWTPDPDPRAPRADGGGGADDADVDVDVDVDGTGGAPPGAGVAVAAAPPRGLPLPAAGAFGGGMMGGVSFRFTFGINRQLVEVLGDKCR